VFIVLLVIYFVMTQSGNFWIHPRIAALLPFVLLSLPEAAESQCSCELYEPGHGSTA